MIDQAQQMPSSFEGRHGNFAVSLRLTPETEFLETQVQRTNTMEKYTQFIDREFITKS
jgi:hypothetical protein